MLEQRENIDVCQGEEGGSEVIWFAFLKDFHHAHIHSPNNPLHCNQCCPAKEKVDNLSVIPLYLQNKAQPP